MSRRVRRAQYDLELANALRGPGATACVTRARINLCQSEMQLASFWRDAIPDTASLLYSGVAALLVLGVGLAWAYGKKVRRAEEGTRVAD